MRSTHEKGELVDSNKDDSQPTNLEKANTHPNHSETEKSEELDAEAMDVDVADSRPAGEQVHSPSQVVSEPTESQPMSARPACPQPLGEGGLESHQIGSDHAEADVANSQADSELVNSQSSPASEPLDSLSTDAGLANPPALGEENIHSHPVGSEHVDSQPASAELVHSHVVDAQPMEKEQADTQQNRSHLGKSEQVHMEPMDADVADSKPMGEEVHPQTQTVSEPVDSQQTEAGVSHPQPLGEDIYPDAISSEHAHANIAESQPVDKQVNSDSQLVSVPVDPQSMSTGPVGSEHEHPHQVNSELVHSEPVNEDVVHSQPEDSQPTDSEQANAVQNHPEMVKPEQVHLQSHNVNEPVGSQPMDGGLAHPQPLGEEDIYSHPVSSDLVHMGVDSQPMGGQVDSHPMSDELAHPQPLGEEDMYPHTVSSEHVHSHHMSSELIHSQADSLELVHLQPSNAQLSHSQQVTAELVYTQSINSEIVHSQPVSSELVHLPHANLEPVHLQPVGIELVNSHSVGTELANAHAVGMELVNTEPLSAELPNSQQITPETQPNKRRKKKSIVWEHFTIENVGAGCRRACCKVCKQSFAYSTGSKVAGTSHLKRHIAKGTCPVILRQQEKNQLTPYMPKSEGGTDTGTNTGTNPPKRRYRTSSSPYLLFDQDRCRHEIARMIIMHDYPLHMVEHPGFVSFVQNLQPRFDMVSFNIVQGDCVATFLREKQNLQRFIEGIPGRVCLTLDMWTSSHSTGYVFITGQFIDNDWKLHRRLLNVVIEPFPEADTALSHAVGTCLSDWGLDRKLASITFNQPLSETALENLRALLAVKNPLVLNGQLLIRNCIARTLSSMAQDVLGAGQETIKKIRASVKYVKTSESHEEKFLELKQQLQVPTDKSLSLDNTTKWNTTYEMLLAASEMKEVFSCLDTSDPEYKDAPSMEDWKQVENICMYLKLLYDTANMLTVKSPQSTNVFFHEVWKIQLELARAAASDDLFVSGLARPLQDKFHKYWKNSCLILAIAVAMDPRFKMKLVEFSFTKIFGEEAPIYIRVVDDGIHELFHEYMNLPLPAFGEDGSAGKVKAEDEQGGNLLTSSGLLDFDMYIMETTSQQMKSELDQYLEESLLPRVQDFDVLGWWKLNKVKYPTLSKMARDIFSIPISTVPPESIFDTVATEMDPYRSSLRPETVEALICAKDWLQQESSKSIKEPVKMEQL